MKKTLYIWLCLCLTAVFVMPGTTHAQTIDTVCASGVAQVYRVKQTPGSVYFWSVDDKGGSITSNPLLDSVKVQWHGIPGIYTIKVVEQNKFGCLGDTVSAQVIIREGLTVSIFGPGEICEGDFAILSASGAKKYRWSTGETSASIIIKPLSLTNYSVIGFDDGCKPDTALFTVNVNPKPKADFSFSPKEPEVDQKVTFYYTGSTGTTYEWWLDNGNTIIKSSGGSNNNAEFIYNQPGIKEVTLIVKNKAGCTDAITYKLFINAPSQIFVPTAFTPDGDGLNDVFKPVMHGIKSVEMIIYNRWGQAVHTIISTDGSWDGKLDNTQVEEGMYYYTLKAQGTDNKWHYLNGNVNIIY